MTTVDPNALIQAAARYGIPPAILRGIALRENALTGNPEQDQAWVANAARQLGQNFSGTGSWERALAQYHGGDPAAKSPHPSANWATAVLGMAGAQPDYGLNQYKPEDPAQFQNGADAFIKSLGKLSRLGGVVTDDAIQGFSRHANGMYPPRPQPENMPSLPLERAPAQRPSGLDFQAVGDFVRQALEKGIDPEHFAANYPYAASVGRRLSGKAPTLDQWSDMVGFQPAQILQHLANMPHPIYPEITSGNFHQAMHRAGLQSSKLAGRMPYASEAARFASTGANEKVMQDYYTPQQTSGAGQAQAPVSTQTPPKSQPVARRV